MKEYKVNDKFIIQRSDNNLSIFNPEKSYLFSLNQTASYIFTKIQKHEKVNDIIRSLAKQYAISIPEAEKSVKECIDYLISEKIINK